MPWCSSCDRFLAPSTVVTDGTCPSCGQVVEPGRAHAPVAKGETELDPLPWHFKVLVTAIALYLGYRAFQGIVLLVQAL